MGRFFSDQQLIDAIGGLQSTLQQFGNFSIVPPDSQILAELVKRLVRRLPPIGADIDEEGNPTFSENNRMHSLLAGWVYWLGQGSLIKQDALSFLEINRLCDQSLLQAAMRDSSGQNLMTVLGRGDIIECIRSHKLVISPTLSKDQIRSVDLRMGNIVLMVRARQASHVDPVALKRASRTQDHLGEASRQQKHERYEIPFRTKFLLHPGSLALVPTFEWLQLPPRFAWDCSRRGRVGAREGLSIATAEKVD